MKNLSLLIILSHLSIFIHAQHDSLTVAPDAEIFQKKKNVFSNPSLTIDLDILIGIPIGEFRAFYSKNKIGGGGFTILHPIARKTPIDVGLGFGAYYMSNSSKTFPYYSPNLGTYNVESRVSGRMFEFNLVTRMYPLKYTGFIIQPYLEGLVGVKVFGANQRLKTYLVDTDEYLPVEKDFNHTSSYSYGYGGGLKIPLGRSNSTFLNVKAIKIYGTPTHNMDPQSVKLYDDLSYEFDEFKSRTDLFRFSIGIHFLI